MVVVLAEGLEAAERGASHPDDAPGDLKLDRREEPCLVPGLVPLLRRPLLVLRISYVTIRK